MAAGRDNCFVVDIKKRLWAWGYGGDYQTGLGTTDSQELPVRVRGQLPESAKVEWVESRSSFTFMGVPAE